MDCVFNSNKEVLDKVREKGFSNDEMNNTYEFDCECGNKIKMSTFEYACDNCGGVYAITPCSQDDVNNIVFVK